MERLSRHARRTLLAIIGGVMAVSILFSVILAPIVRDVFVLRAQTMQAFSSLSSGAFTTGLEELRVLRTHVQTLINRLHGYATYESVPFIGSEIRLMREGLRGADQALQGAMTLTMVAADVSEEYTRVFAAHEGEASLSWATLSREERRSVLGRWMQDSAELHGARDHLMSALDSFERVRESSPSMLLPSSVNVFMRTIPLWQDRLVQAFGALDLFGPLAGYPQSKTYLVVLQNADELRPSGGFIGVIGEVHVDAGTIDRMSFGDVYALDKLTEGAWTDVPPAIISRELGTRAWYLRDQNWSPDFPTTAQALASAYSRERTLADPAYIGSVDGVIALEPTLFKELLSRTGPITIDGITYSAETFFDQLQFQVEQGFREQQIPVEKRKEVVARLGTELMNRLTRLPREQWVNLFDLVFRSLTQKDIQLWMRDASLQAMLDARGWNGRAISSAQDYLWVVDANLAALKTDGMMEKKITYALDARDPNRARATVTLAYTNNTKTIDWRYTRYRSYTRVYVPEGSTLISSDGGVGATDVMRDLGKTVFGAFWVIEPGQTKTLTFSYLLPANLLHPEAYTLLVQRQAGARHELTLDLSFGKKLTRAYPPEDASRQQDSIYSITQQITRDQMFSVEAP